MKKTFFFVVVAAVYMLSGLSAGCSYFSGPPADAIPKQVGAYNLERSFNVSPAEFNPYHGYYGDYRSRVHLTDPAPQNIEPEIQLDIKVTPTAEEAQNHLDQLKEYNVRDPLLYTKYTTEGNKWVAVSDDGLAHLSRRSIHITWVHDKWFCEVTAVGIPTGVSTEYVPDARDFVEALPYR